MEAGLDTPGIDFTVEVEDELSTLSTRRTTRGLRISSRPSLGRLLEKLNNGRLCGKGNEKKR